MKPISLPSSLSYKSFGTEFSPNFDFDYENNVITAAACKFPWLSEYFYNLPILNPDQKDDQENVQDPFSDEELRKRYLHAISGTKPSVKDNSHRMYLGIVNFLVKVDEDEYYRKSVQLIALPSLYTLAKSNRIIFTLSISQEQMLVFEEEREHFFLHLLDTAEKLNERS